MMSEADQFDPKAAADDERLGYGSPIIMISLQKGAWIARHPRAALREFRTVRDLSKTPHKFGDEPWFNREDVSEVATLLDPARSVVEYGCGSSTLFFAGRSSWVSSVESSKSYGAAVRAEGARRSLSNIVLTVVDLGPVRDWGWPIDHYPTKRNVQKWRRYLAAPWEKLGDSKVGLVIVDGRFRAACAAYALARLVERGELDAVVMIDDFVGREASYGRVAEIADLKSTTGRAVLTRPHDVDMAKADAFAERWIVDLR